MNSAKMLAAVIAAILIVPAPVSAAVTAPPARITGRIAGPDGGWDLLSVDPAHHRLLVARTDGVMAVDLATGKVTPKFVEGGRIHAVFAIPGSNIGVATSGSANRAILFDADSGKVKTRVPTGANPDAAIYDPATKKVWVMNPDDGSATIIDPFRAKVVATVAIGGSLELPAIDGRGHLFVNVEDRNQIVELDLASRHIVRRIALPGCDGPTGLAYVASGILISACGNGVAKLVDAANGRVVGTLPIGPGPDGAFTDPAHHRAYIPSGGDGSLTIIDTSARLPKVSGKILTQLGARTGTLDQATGRIYLPTAGIKPGADKAFLPGTFELIVVGTAEE